ncbi:hypothetical protein [Luteibacter jiangsuensis]
MTSARGIGFEHRISPVPVSPARSFVVEHRPSGILTFLAAAILCLATLAPLLTSLPWYLRAPLAALVGVGGVRRLRAFRHSPIAACSLSVTGLWQVTLRPRRDVPAELTLARVFGGAVFLELRWRGGSGRVALLPDNLAADELRFLRAHIRTAPHCRSRYSGEEPTKR